MQVKKRQGAEHDKILVMAHKLIDEGISIFPVEPFTKKPVDDWKEFQSRIMSHDEVEKRFLLGYNIAIVCGKISGNLVVLDFDDIKLYDAWTPKNETRTNYSGKGVHVYYRLAYAVKTSHFKKRYGIPFDTQGEGSYVVAPPSWHMEKSKYYTHDANSPWEIKFFEGDIEDCVFTFLRKKFKEKLKDVDFDAITEQIDIDKILAGSEEGTRNDDAIRLASWYRVGECSEENTLQKMLTWSREKCNPPLSESEITVTVESAFKADPPYFSHSFSRLPTATEMEPVEELTPEMEAFLKDASVLENCLKIFQYKIVGEEELILMHFLVGVGTSFVARPFGIIIVNQLGVGKSYVQEQVASIFPQERVDQPTSVTEKVVNYLAGSFKGRVVRIDELFGTEEGMPYIRVWMTNGRLEHWVTDKDTLQPRKIKTEGSPVFMTTTTGIVEAQYGSRNWILACNISTEQTKDIHRFQEVKDLIPDKLNDAQENQVAFLTKVIRWILQNAKQVLIPFRISFPFENPRTRRDKPKFKDMIKCIAQVRQLQRKQFEYKGKTYIIAEAQDFEDAFRICAKFLTSTLLTLDDDCIKILGWARKEAQTNTFTASEVKRGTNIPKTTLYRRLAHLTDLGYVDAIMDASGQKAAAYELTELGLEEQVVNIKIVDSGEAIVQLYKSLSDSKSEQKLRSLCTTFLTVERREARESDEATETLVHKERADKSDSKKERAPQKVQSNMEEWKGAPES